MGQPGTGSYLTVGLPREGPQSPQGLHSSPWKGTGEPVVQIRGPLSYEGRLFREWGPAVRSLHRLGLHCCPQYSRFS